MSASRTLFVGLGSPHGDDQIGWRVAEELRRRHPGHPVRLGPTPSALLDWLEGVDRLTVCDAVRGDRPGRLHFWEWPTPQLGRLRSSGSHAFGLTAVLELAERLGRLPAAVHVWGVEIRHVAPASAVSVELRNQLHSLVDQIKVQCLVESQSVARVINR